MKKITHLKKLYCLIIILVLPLASLGTTYKSSADFPDQYNADVAMDHRDGPYDNDTFVRWSNTQSHYITDGIAYWVLNEEGGGPQCDPGTFISHKNGNTAHIFDVPSGFTVELRIKGEDVGCSNSFAPWTFLIEMDENGYRADIRAYSDRVVICGNTYYLVGEQAFSSYDWHTLRVAYYPGKTGYDIWIDGVHMGVHVYITGSPSDRFYFGDLGSINHGLFALDYLRLDDSGPYAPIPGLVELVESNGDTTISEVEQTGDSYTISLTTDPEDIVTITAEPQCDEVSINGQSPGASADIVFTPTGVGAPPEPQTINVTGIDDGIFEDERFCVITHLVTSNDTEYDGLPVDDVTVRIESDPYCGQPGTTYLSGDLNKDCNVNTADLAKFAEDWLLCTTPGVSECLSGTAVSNVSPFGAMYNYDGDFSFNSFDPNVAKRGIEMMINSLGGTSVGTVVFHVGLASDIMHYPTQVSSNWGWRTTPDEDSNPQIGVRVAKGRACVAAGVDSVRTAGEQAKEMGLMFIPSLRMNDWHFTRDPHNYFATGEFWINNENTLTIKASGGQSPISGKPDCVELFDFSYPEVRQYRYDQINEIITRNEDIIDGFEMDFSRSFVFFPAGQAAAKSHLMTALVDDVRQRLDQLEDQNNRKYYLIARVPPTIEKCNWSGLDIDVWIDQGLIDVIVPSQLMTTYFEMPINEFVALTQGSSCRVYAGLYPRVGWYYPFAASPTVDTYDVAGQVTISQEMLRAAVTNYWHQGVDGIYAYNFGLPAGNDSLRRLVDMGPADTTREENKVFPVTKSYWLDYEDSFLPPKQLPLGLDSNQSYTIDIYVGEDISPGATRMDMIYSGLRLGFRNIDVGLDIVVKLNDYILFDGQAGDKLLSVTGPEPDHGHYGDPARAFWQSIIPNVGILKRGFNEVELTIGNGAAGNLSLTDAEIGVVYEEKTTSVLYEAE